MTATGDPFYEAIATVRDAVRDLIESVDLESSTLPDAEFPAMREISQQYEYVGEWGAEPVEHAHVLGVWKLGLAVDCAKAMIRDLHTGIKLRRAAIGLSSSDVNLALAVGGMGLIRAIENERVLMGRETEEWSAIRSAALEAFGAAMVLSVSD